MNGQKEKEEEEEKERWKGREGKSDVGIPFCS